jgi:hypothetical protein
MGKIKRGKKSGEAGNLVDHLNFPLVEKAKISLQTINN